MSFGKADCGGLKRKIIQSINVPTGSTQALDLQIPVNQQINRRVPGVAQVPSKNKMV